MAVPCRVFLPFAIPVHVDGKVLHPLSERQALPQAHDIEGDRRRERQHHLALRHAVIRRPGCAGVAVEQIGGMEVRIVAPDVAGCGATLPRKVVVENLYQALPETEQGMHILCVKLPAPVWREIQQQSAPRPTDWK